MSKAFIRDEQGVSCLKNRCVQLASGYRARSRLKCLSWMSNRSRERLPPPQAESEAPSRLQRVVHFELDRMHSLAIALQFGRLQFDIRVEHRIREPAANRHQLTASVERVERLIQPVAHDLVRSVFSR